MMRDLAVICLVLLGALASPPTPAKAWELFRSPNDDVEEGNEALAAGDAQTALEAYERAAAALPDRADVQLNRGLALSELGRLDEAREAFDRATRGAGDPSVRGDAYYNLGRNFMSQADELAKQQDLEAAQGQLREARDALQQSLRNRPGFDDAAWNLELVQRRLVELEKQQQQQEQQEQQDQDGEQEQSENSQQSEDGKPQDGKPQDGEPQDGEQQDGDQQQPEGDQPQDSEPQDGKQPEGDQQQPEDGEPQDGDDSQQAQQRPQQGEGEREPEPRPAESQQHEPTEGEREPLPRHVRQVLDALQDGEETMQRHQARTRAQQRPRRVEKDW